MSRDKYSVLMSVYGKDIPAYVATAVESMLNQTVPPEEYVIVVDGPVTDELKELISTYEANRELFTVVWLQENKGLGNALNVGLEYCRNELVARMDADDISLPTRCEKELEMFEKDQRLDICGCNIDEFYGSTNNAKTSKEVFGTYEERKSLRGEGLKVKRVAVISYGYAWLPAESGPSRFYDIARILSENGYKVDLVGARFQHFNKKERDTEQLWHREWPFELYFIDAPKYKKNVDLRRVYSNYIAARNIKKFLEMNRGKYDVMYCSIPANNIAKVVAKFCYEQKIPLVVDIEDLWPEAMEMIMDIPIVSDVLYFPMKKDAEYVYSVADAVVGTSDEYAGRAIKYHKRNIPIYTVYVGCDIDLFDNAVRENENYIEKDNNEFWVTYAGSLGKSYDIKTLVLAAKEILKTGNNKIKIKLLGSGPEREKLEELKEKEHITNVEFLGYVDYQKMTAYLYKSDLLVNSFVRGAPQSIVNKVGDYLAAGKPMINTLESKEFWNKVVHDGFGTNVEPENVGALKTAVLDYYEDRNKCVRQGVVARKIAEEQFARKASYRKIVEILDNVCRD